MRRRGPPHMGEPIVAPTGAAAAKGAGARSRRVKSVSDSRKAAPGPSSPARDSPRKSLRRVGKRVEPTSGLEPLTCSLRVSGPGSAGGGVWVASGRSASRMSGWEMAGRGRELALGACQIRVKSTAGRLAQAPAANGQGRGGKELSNFVADRN
jgi:hypothetical protein